MLEQLITDFCRQNIGSRKWHKSAYLMLSALQKLPGLSRNYYSQEYIPDYEEIFNDTLMAIAKNICQEFRQPEEEYENSLAVWINYKLRLYYKNKDMLRQNKHKPLPLDGYTNEEEQTTFLEQLSEQLNLNTIEQLIEEQQKAAEAKTAQQIWDYIEQDPENLLKNCHLEGFAACNCYYLTQKRHLSPKPVAFKELAAELKVPQGTLTSHWHRRCKPILKDIAKKFS